MPAEPPLSIYDLPPLETGGSRSREGLIFQDHVAAGFCLDMLVDSELAEVWCETQDDVTLIWKRTEGIIVEFTQAKSDCFDQLWSVSKLCQRDASRVGTSILEKSLAYDRCSERALFRLVTLRPFNSELEVLTWERGCKARIEADGKITEVQRLLHGKLADFNSANGKDCREWAMRAYLDARHGERPLMDANLRKLRVKLESDGYVVIEGQVEEIYLQLVAKIGFASRLDARLRVQEKRFSRERFAELLRSTTEAYLMPSTGGGKVLQVKMEKAALPADTIASAQDLRRAYRRRALTPRYQNDPERPLLDDEVAALLHGLKAKLDSGALPDEGPQFFNLCLQTLADFQASFPQGRRPSLADLLGAMYTIADRCLHRFRRVEA